MQRIALAVVLLVLAIATADAHAALKRAGFLGVQVASLPESEAAPGRAGGLLVQGLVEGGSAKAAGVQPNDIVLRLDGKEVTSIGEFVGMARRLRAGDVAVMEVMRGSSALRLEVPVKPRPPERFEGIAAELGEVRVDAHARRTLWTVPPGGGRHPAILFVTGVGCFSQELTDPRDSVAQLLQGLTRAGFVTMRVEKSGMGDSEGPACASPQADLHAEVRGYVAGARALKQDPRVDPERVFLVGLSIGGIEAPLIARQEAFKGIVVINTSSKPFYEYLLETRRRQLELSGTPHDEIDRRMLVGARCSHAVLVEKLSPDEVLKRSPECREDVQFPAPYTYMQQWAALNLPAEWKATRAPVLVVAGTSDFVATVGEAPYLARILDSFQPGRATLRMIEGMDHFLAKAPTMAASMARTGPGEFEPAVLAETRDWLLRESGRNR